MDINYKKFRTDKESHSIPSDIEDRAVILAEYIIENKATVRAAAKQFGISKSTVHMVMGI